MVQKTVTTLADLYRLDETAWLESMAEMIREGRRGDLDYPHLAEFLTDMAIRDRSEVSSRLRVLLVHVLKWIHQQSMRTLSWAGTILHQQDDLADLVEAGVLRNHAEDVLAKVYQKAVKNAARETGLAESIFPAECPWTLDQLLAPEILDD
jgi:hypothetical protein